MANAIPPGFAGVGADSSWQDRLREAAYTSPGGTRLTFDYEAVGRETTARGTVFEFPGVNDAYVQRTGFGPRRYPMRCFFWGSSHDLVATAFEAALLEPGIGKLEHPLYGTFDVVPFGDIVRRDDLKSAANQTVIEVTFWTTTRAIYPSAQTDAKSEILAAIDNFDAVAAQRFADVANLGGALQQANEAATIRKFLGEVGDSLDEVSRAVSAVNRAFASIERDINTGLDVFVGKPLLLAQQVSNLIKAPARAFVGIKSRLAAYRRMGERIRDSDPADPTTPLSSGAALTVRTDKIANDFHTADFFVLTAIAAAVTAVTADQVSEDGIVSGPIFFAKPDAIDAADEILDQFDDAVSWRDTGLQALEENVANVHAYQIDTGESYQALHAAVALAIGNLIEISFDLIPERVVVLDRPRTIIDLAAELYTDAPDAWLDRIINDNGLTGSEILEVPRGRAIRYYPPQ